MKKISTENKVKLIYSGELAIIALVVLVIGILKLTGVIQTKPLRLLIYNIISLAGAAYLIFDLIWALVSPKKRKKSCLLDKFMVVPAFCYLIFFDIFCFINKAKGLEPEPDDLFIKLSIGIVLLYISAVYLFQAIYHFKHPVPQLLEAIEEAKKEDENIVNEEEILEDNKNETEE